ncbi:hypothetical protein INR49_017264 [Caranx melampygus]|nr:hypothetical protein INR49_017264 [Caranx melampygus]
MVHHRVRCEDLLTVQSRPSHLGHLATVKSARADDREHLVNRKKSSCFWNERAEDMLRVLYLAECSGMWERSTRFSPGFVFIALTQEAHSGLTAWKTSGRLLPQCSSALLPLPVMPKKYNQDHKDDYKQQQRQQRKDHQEGIGGFLRKFAKVWRPCNLVVNVSPFTFVHKQQLSLVYVRLGEVEHRLHGGTLQGQVSVAWRGHHELELLRRCVLVLCPQILWADFDLKWDEAWDDVNRHPNVADVSDPVGGVEDEGVVGFVRLHLHVLDVPIVNVLLAKRLDRGLFGSNVALLCFDKTAEKAMRGGYLDCEYNLRWQVVLMSDLQRSENIEVVGLASSEKQQAIGAGGPEANTEHVMVGRLRCLELYKAVAIEGGC